jgi:hypothetical protein
MKPCQRRRSKNLIEIVRFRTYLVYIWITITIIMTNLLVLHRIVRREGGKSNYSFVKKKLHPFIHRIRNTVLIP